MAILYLEIPDGLVFLKAVAAIERFGVDTTLRFSREGLSLTAENDGKVDAGLRILAGGGGCQRFSCSESRSARLKLYTFFHTTLETYNRESALSISIEIDPTVETIEEGSTTAYLKVFWFNLGQEAEISEASDQQGVAADNKILLRLWNADKQTTLLEFDESMYEAAAGLSLAGYISLDEKLQDLLKRNNRTEEGTWIMFLITPAKLGFFTCCNGWVQEGDGDVVKVFRKDGAVKDMRMGVYYVPLLRVIIRIAKAFEEGRFWIHIQDSLPILLRMPLICDDGHGDGVLLGSLYFFSNAPPLHRTQLHLPPFHHSTFSYLKSL